VTRAAGIRVTVRRSNLNDGYLITPNGLFRGTGVYAALSVHERMYLGAGLSCSNAYDTTLEELDACIGSLGRDKREAVRRKLREEGFLTLERVSDGHTFIWEFMFHMDPLPVADRDVLPAKKTKPAPAKRFPPQLRQADVSAGQSKPCNPGHGRSPDGQGMAEALDPQGLGVQGDVYKEEKNHSKKNQNPPPPVVDQPAGGDPPGVSAEEGEIGENKTNKTLDSYVAWFAGNTPWPAALITEVLTAAVNRGLGDLHRCATALRDIAEGRHGATGSPRRLLAEAGPWWKTAPEPKKATRNRKSGPRCQVMYHGREPADGCLMCASDRLAGEEPPVDTRTSAAGVATGRRRTPTMAPA
jgi:hypothetical protein